MPGWGVVALIGSAVGIGVLAGRGSVARRVRRRERLEEAEIWERFYAGSGLDRAVVAEAWAEAARTLRVRPGLLRPGDRFGQEVGKASGLLTPELDGLGDRAMARARASGGVPDLGAVETVDGYVRLVCRLAGAAEG